MSAGSTDWLTASAILVAGLILGSMFIYFFSRQKKQPDVGLRDLEAKRDDLLRRLREARDLPADERQAFFEDLYASSTQDVVVGINEGFFATGSAFWAVSYRHAFGLTSPPKGYPRRDC